jgi:hypothetical protein
VVLPQLDKIPLWRVYNLPAFGYTEIEMDTKAKQYEIRIEGHLGPSVAVWFPGLVIYQETNGDTTLSGPIVDQAALHGVLMRIRDLGLVLISVHRLKDTDSQG